MMGYIWGGMIVLSFLFGMIGGQTEAVAQAALDGAKNAVDMALSLLGMMCLWSGLLEIAKQSGLTEKLARLIRPLTRFLFPGLPPDSPAVMAMVMNMTANFLGLSNAATPLGLAAMEELHKINPRPERASDEMCMFVVINTASISLIPTTVIALRSAAGSVDPFGIVAPVWICSSLALLVGVMASKLMARRKRGQR
ncbi:MAG: nucleoside recognition protein [Ruminococcaceae bacterium]|nr:nucleoside recognition protein [Oscillospiraceae bacterium]